MAGTNSWTSSGPPGGTIYDIAVDPTTPSTLYAATEGRLYKSTDSAASWVAVASAPSSDIVTSVEIDPANTATIYLTTRTRGVWKSTNAGSTWTRISSGIAVGEYADTYVALHAICMTPGNAAVLYVGTGDGRVFKSTNSGSSWSPAGTLPTSGGELGAVFALKVDPRATSTIYAGLNFNGSETEDGMFKSTNGGATWTNITGSLPLRAGVAYDVFDIAIDSIPNPSVVYIASGGAGVAKTADGGSTWTVLNQNLDGSVTFLRGHSIELDPVSPSTIYAGLINRIVKSTNGGASWTSLTSGLTGQYVGALAIDPSNGSKLYAGNNSSLCKTTNGGSSWSEAIAGLNSVPLKAIVYDSATSVLFASGRDVIYKSTDNGASWSVASRALAGYTAVDLAMRGTTLYALLLTNGCRSDERGGHFATSTDAGATWSSISSLQIGLGYAHSMAVAPSDGTIYVSSNAAQERNVLKSSNGTTWTDISGTIDVGSIETPIVVHPTNSQVAYVGGSNGVYKTTNGGGSWTHQTFNEFSFEQALSLYIDPTNGNRILAGTIYYLHESLDGGATWTQFSVVDAETVGSGYEEFYGSAIVTDPANADHFLVGTRLYGVFRTTDGGTSWTAVASGLDDRRIRALAWGASGRLHAATGGSVFSIDFVATGPPPVLTATGGASNVSLSWTNNGATQYVVERRQSITVPFEQVAVVNGTTHTDSNVVSSSTYLYRVRASGSIDNSNSDHATVISFTDASLTGVSVKGVHLTQLRVAVNAVRTAANLDAASWTDGSPSGVVIKATHITELRSALTQALTVLGKTLTVTDGALGGIAVKAMHFQELRNATR